MKKLYMTMDRERNLVRYSERNDQKDAFEVTEGKAMEVLTRKYTPQAAARYLKEIKESIFESWYVY